MKTTPMIKSRTLWFNWLVVLAGVINEVHTVVADTTLTRSAIVLAIVNVVLRHLTNSAVTVSGKPNHPDA